MGGPGIVMSRMTLRLVAPHLRSCLMEMFTTHEDVELGRYYLVIFHMAMRLSLLLYAINLCYQL